MKELYWHYYWTLYDKSALFRTVRHFYKYVLKIDPYLQALILLVFIGLVVYSKCKKYKLIDGLALSITIPYVMVLYSSLVLSRGHNPDYLYSFELFWSIKCAIEYPTFTKEILLNLTMLLPIGIFCPNLFEKDKWKVIPIGISISVSIELLQLITKTGMCELDDVIYNTTGLLVGYGIYCLIAYLKNLIDNKIQEKNDGI